MDLLTAVTHELGHVLGLNHDSDAPFMAESLETGLRLAPYVEKEFVAASNLAQDQQNNIKVFSESLNELLDPEEANLLGALSGLDGDDRLEDDFIVDGFVSQLEDENESTDSDTQVSKSQSKKASKGGSVNIGSGIIDWSTRSGLVNKISS